MSASVITEIIRTLRFGGELEISEVSLVAEDILGYGLYIEEQQILLPANLEWLEPEAIWCDLTPQATRWMKNLQIFPAIGSTNTELADLATKQPIDGWVFTAELQTTGRGRRGRQWQSPLGKNIALSLGVGLTGGLQSVGGLSLVVGLAAIDALNQLGLKEKLALKWPNDILLDGRKLAGILIELVSGRSGTSAVIGIGVNFAFEDGAAPRAAVDQPLADLAETGLAVSRNQLLAKLISTISQFSEHFSESGFSEFVNLYNENHFYHEKTVDILVGEERTEGVVRGVTHEGLLRLETASGIHEFNGGEVSLRPR